MAKAPEGSTLLTEVSSVFEAQVVTQLLEGAGIPSIVKGKKKATRYDLVYDALGMNVGQCEIFVPEAALEEAQEILEAGREAAQELEDGEG